jgi:hypothetical protein
VLLWGNHELDRETHADGVANVERISMPLSTCSWHHVREDIVGAKTPSQPWCYWVSTYYSTVQYSTVLRQMLSNWCGP